MKGDPRVIAALQAAIPIELQLSAQYHLDAQNLHELGFKKFSDKLADFGEDCEEFVRKLGKRLLYFEVKPQYVTALDAKTADGLTAMFQAVLDAEQEIVTDYNAAAVVALEAKDDNTRNLFEHLIKFHEQNTMGKHGGCHIAWLQRRLSQIGQYGEREFALQFVK